MAYTLDVGKTELFAIEFLDQDGKPMDPTPRPDAPPSWAQTDPGVESLSPSPDGMNAQASGLAAGTDTIQLSLSVGGQSFTATVDATVNAVQPTQTLTSIGIVATPAP